MDYSSLSSHELACLCLGSDDEIAWAEFVRRFHPLIATIVLRVCRKWGEDSPQTVDDLVQDTYLKLCTRRSHLLQTFKPAHPDAIYGYIKVFTRNLVLDYFKGSRCEKSGGSHATVSIDAGEPGPDSPVAAARPAGLEREVLLHQIDACLRAVLTGPTSTRDRKIFWLYYRVGLTANAIAALPTIGLTTKGVESTILRTTRLVRERASCKAAESEANRSKGMRARESF